MLKELGLLCKTIRLRLGKTQLDVAMDTDYSVSNVSEFENGRNNNAIIFSWYARFFNSGDMVELNNFIWRDLNDAE